MQRNELVSHCMCRNNFAPQDAKSHYAPDLQIEPQHIQIALEVDLDKKSIQGSVQYTVFSHVDGVDTLTLDAVSFAHVLVENDTRDINFSYDGTQIYIHWKKPLSALESRIFTINYSVIEPVSGILFSKPTNSMPDASWFAVTDHETERARHWLPCIDHPSVRPKVSFKLTADERWTILASGILVNEIQNENHTKTAFWELNHPCPSYLTCFAIGDFIKFSEGNLRDIQVSAFSLGQQSELTLKRTFQGTLKRLQFFENKLGVSYPYPKYYQFAVRGIGGAMENISLVSWDDRFLLTDEAHALEERSLFEVVDAHEMAHAWFGDLITCRDFAHAWLKESWATYMETVWLEYAYGKDAKDYDLLCNAESYFQECDNRYQRPIVTRRFESSWDMYDVHLYQGGAWRLHMLRHYLGEDIFWNAVTDYLQKYSNRVVETDDFRKVLEEHSARSLASFFDQWIYQAGFPDLEIKFTYDAQTKKGTFEVLQKQVDKDAAPFTFMLNLVVFSNLGEQNHKIYVQEKTAILVISLENNPDLILIDPQCELLARISFDYGITRAKKMLHAGQSIRARIEAGRYIIQKGQRNEVENIFAAYQTETFWGVRVKWIEALGKANTEAAFNVLLQIANLGPSKLRDQREGAPLFRALRKYHDSRVIKCIESWLEIDRDSQPIYPRTFEALYEALGSQRMNAPIKHLIDAALNEKNYFICSGAIRGLGLSWQNEAFKHLLGWLESKRMSFRVRPVICAALGLILPALEQSDRTVCIDALISALRDEDRLMRNAAALALVAANAHEASDALAKYAITLTHQERVHLERQIKSLKNKETSEISNLQMKLEELEKKLRTMGEKVEKLESAIP